MLPHWWMTNRSPGSCWVTSSGTTRLSEQVTNRTFGVLRLGSELFEELRSLRKTSFWNFRNPSMTFALHAPWRWSC